MTPRPDLKEIGTTGLRRTGGTVYEEFLVSLRGRRGAKKLSCALIGVLKPRLKKDQTVKRLSLLKPVFMI
jgi:hypothetical protein